MQQDAIDCAAQAMEKYNIEKDIAAYIKKEFDKKYNPTWHCIVGRNFGQFFHTSPGARTCLTLCFAITGGIPPLQLKFLIFNALRTGSYVTHETKHFIYFYLGQVAILLFKSG